MKNQAHSLEMLMDNKRKKRFHDFKQSLSRSQNIITVSSGKGGSGKSTFVTNISVALAQLKKKVLVLDADLGLANLHILFNQKKTKDLSHVFREDVSIRDVIVSTPFQVDIIFGGSGVSSLVDLSEEEIWLFLDQIKDFKEYDFIIIDVGAGISKSVLTFLRVASQVILVATPEPTALTDAYGLIKAFLNFSQNSYVVDDFFVVMNKSISMQQSEVAMTRLHQACKRYLNIQVKKLGYLPKDEYLVNSVYQRKPLVTTMPTCQFSRLIYSMGKNIIKEVEHNNTTKETESNVKMIEFEKLIKKLIS